MADTRKTDRRTIYTRKAIQDAFLRVKQTKDYNMITVADVCREAQISRATFYTHYKNIPEVLDALLTEVLSSRDFIGKFLPSPDSDYECAGIRCGYPFCELVRNSPELMCIFFDYTLDHMVIRKLVELYREDYFRGIQELSGPLSEHDAEVLFWFQINGCYAISRQYSDCASEEWDCVKCMMHRFIRGGAVSIPQKES